MANLESPPVQEEENLGKVELIPIDQIGVPDERITSVHEQELMEEIYRSLDIEGQKDPIRLKNVNGNLILVDGLHRLLWAQKRGHSHLKAIVELGTMRDVLIDNIILNRQRGKSDPIGEGLVLVTLQNEEGMTLQEAADSVGMSKQWASKLCKIQRLDEYTRQMIRQGRLSVSAAFYIADLPTYEDQQEVVEWALKYSYTVEQTKLAVQSKLNPEWEPEPGQYDVQPSGEMIMTYPECLLCGKECIGAEKWEVFHPECLQDIKAAIRHSHQKETTPPTPPPFQSHPPTPPTFQTECPHQQTTITSNGAIVCLRCHAFLGFIQQ